MSVAAPLVCAGCLAVSTGTGSDAGAPTSAGDADTTTEAGPQTGGTSCGADPTTGVTLCLQTNACPGATLDTSAFPGCGFRPGGGSAYDLECLCNGTELCPIGVPTSCDAVAQLLTQQQSALQVCQQVSTGSCVSLAPDAGGAGTSTLSGACQECVAGCGSAPSCYQACGC